MLEQRVASAIIKAVEHGFDEQLRFTEDLVRIPSLRGQEHTAQDFMAAAMAARGLSVDQWPINVDDIRHLPGFAPATISYENSFNVVGTYRPATRKGRSLIFNGHVDVVPTGDAARWTIPAFHPRIDGCWMYGRGAGDMKSGLAATLFAFDAVRAAGFLPAAPIHFQSVVEEECTGNGTLACLQRGYKADCAFIPEPLQPKLMRAEVGLIWFRVHVSGDPQHASGFTSSGANAIEKALLLWPHIKAMEDIWNSRRSDHPVYKNHPHPIRFNIGEITGGEWTSSVPATATLHIRCSVLPSWSLAEARAEIEACVRNAALTDPFLSNNPPRIEYHGHMAEGYVLENATAQESVLADSHRTVFGLPLEEEVTSAATDARFFGLYQKTPAIVYGPICENAHGFDERVDLDSLRAVTKTMALFLADWCGIERSDA